MAARALARARPFPHDELPVPPQDRVWRHDGGDLTQEYIAWSHWRLARRKISVARNIVADHNEGENPDTAKELPTDYRASFRRYQEEAMNDAGPFASLTNVFVLMLENHSFDNIFAMSGIPGIQAGTVGTSILAPPDPHPTNILCRTARHRA